MSNLEHYEDCELACECECGRGTYHSCEYSSCYACFLDRRSTYIDCIYCGRWHSPEFDTCFQCRPQGRDEAAADLKLTILARDSFRCRYCGAAEGSMQTDPRLVRPMCRPGCSVQHNHRRPCDAGCGRKHRHRNPGDAGVCQLDCTKQHPHLIKDDDGIRPVRLHVDHVKPCAKGGTADPWNLQTLCGVCNIGKGADWWDGSPHDQERRLLIAAYSTYLRGFLSEDEQRQLEIDAFGWPFWMHLTIVRNDYISRVKAQRPRPRVSKEVITEDVPAEYAEFDLPVTGLRAV